MRFLRRLLWVIPLLILEFSYFFIKGLHAPGDGVAPMLPVDSLIPTIPIWSVPYVLIFGYWACLYFWATLKLDDPTFHAWAISGIVAFGITAFIFTFFPTYVNRPVLDGQGWDWDLLRFVYSNDNVYNALPSLHISTTFWLTLFYARWYPRSRWVFWGVFVVVVLSTLFTRQHYILDVLAGMAMAGSAYFFGWWASRKLETRTTQRVTQPATN
ncbi:MAG: hypothetical protein HGA53_09030 [Anaerolineaceae bacterium]|nr:hypothetical protein [Anaerolineaceae bacterium]